LVRDLSTGRTPENDLTSNTVARPLAGEGLGEREVTTKMSC